MVVILNYESKYDLKMLSMINLMKSNTHFFQIQENLHHLEKIIDITPMVLFIFIGLFLVCLTVEKLSEINFKIKNKVYVLFYCKC